MRGPHFLVTFLGTFGDANSPLERWQTSLRVNASSSDGLALLQSKGDAIAAAAHDNFATNIISVSQSGVALIATDVRFIGPDGLQPRGPEGGFVGVGRRDLISPSPATGDPKYPFQIAIVASLNTARAGARGKGRCFLPPPSNSLESDGRISVAAVTGLATRFAAVIGAVNSGFAAAPAPPAPQRVSVMSTFGFASEVTSVRVGRVLDTHRSRRSDQLEGYGPAAGIAS
jgi:hypothetical protein